MQAISITQKKNAIEHAITLHDKVLELEVNSATYLGVQLTSDLTWSQHINKIAAKANRQLGFLKWNLPVQNIKLKEMVRLMLEYCAPV